MQVSLLMLSEFKSLFYIAPTEHGLFIPELTDTGSPVLDERGKAKGRSMLVKEPVTEETIQAHLDGLRSIGGCMLYDGEHCMFAVIDVDDYRLDATILNKIYDNEMPLVPFRSKSGGLHIYLFFSEAMKATDAIDIMQAFRRLLKLPSNTEVFPKQRKIGTNGHGSWINLPYFNAENSARYLIDPDNKPVGFDEALIHIKQSRVTKAQVESYLGDVPFADGPPCLQAIYLDRDTSMRNKYLFAVGVYAKSKYGETFDQFVKDVNQHLTSPLSEQELNSTVLASIRRTDYGYTCSEDPLLSCCARAVCKDREFGIGSPNVSDLSFEQLVQYGIDNPYYKWRINGKDLLFNNSSEIINQQRFRELSVDKLHIMPNRLKEPRWVAIVNNALSNVVVDTEHVNEEMSESGLMLTYLGEYLTTTAPAKTLEHVLLGKAYHDDKRKLYVFKGSSLMAYITEKKKYKGFSAMELQERLKELGGKSVRIYINDRNNAVRVWQLPTESLDGLIDDPNGIDPITDIFNDEATDEVGGY